jgi:hypothetical protein
MRASVFFIFFFVIGLVYCVKKICGSCGCIFRDLSKFNVNRNFIYQTVKRYIETRSSGRRKYTTRKRSVTTRVVVKKIRELIRRKCDISARKLAADSKLNRETVRLVLKMIYNCQEIKNSWTFEGKTFFRREYVCPGAKLNVVNITVRHTASSQLWYGALFPEKGVITSFQETSIIASSKMGCHHTQQKSCRCGAKII